MFLVVRVTTLVTSVHEWQMTNHEWKTHINRNLFLQDELKLALKQGTTLLGCIKEQAAKSENHQLNPDEMENQTTVERYQSVL